MYPHAPYVSVFQSGRQSYFTTMNTNTDYMVANGGQLKNVFNFDLSVVPGAITGLTATTSNAGEIDLSWTVPSFHNAFSETIEQSTDGGTTWTTVAVIDPNLDSYAVTSLDPSLSYKFRVSNGNITGTSTPDTIASLVTPIAQSPSSIVGTLDTNGYMNLSWPASLGATGYDIARETINTGATNSYTSASSTYIDTNRNPADGYRYTVSAINAGGTNSSPSAVFPQPQYAIIDLGTNQAPVAFNNVGSAVLKGVYNGVYTYWTNGASVTIPSGFTPVAVNDSNVVVGTGLHVPLNGVSGGYPFNEDK